MIAPVKRIDQDCPLEVGDRVRRYVSRPGKRNQKMPQLGKIIAIDPGGQRCEVQLDKNFGGQVVTCRMDNIAFEVHPMVFRRRVREIQAMWSEKERESRIVDRRYMVDDDHNPYTIPEVGIYDMVEAFKGGAA